MSLMRHLTAAVLFAIFALLPASPLWSAPADSDCCCGKNGLACCRLAHKSSGPRFEARQSCRHGCAGCAGGLYFSAPGVLPSQITHRAALTKSPLPSKVEGPNAKAGGSVALHQRPPPKLG